MLVLSSCGGGMLWFVGGGVVKFCEHADDVTWHVDVDPALFVFLVQSEAAVEGACPIGGYVVVLLESVDEVVGVDFGDVFDSKVINAQGECYFEGEVEPQAS